MNQTTLRSLRLQHQDNCEYFEHFFVFTKNEMIAVMIMYLLFILYIPDKHKPHARAHRKHLLMDYFFINILQSRLPCIRITVYIIL